MANIKITLDYTIQDGIDLIFNAPCDCSDITGLIVYYPSLDKTVSKTFTFKDTHKNDLGDLTELFVAGARVKVNLDVTNGYAYIQNADTNAYLEGKFASIEERLANLGFKEGSVNLKYTPRDDAINILKRQGNYVMLSLDAVFKDGDYFPKIDTPQESGKYLVGTVPKEFRPTEEIHISAYYKTYNTATYGGQSAMTNPSTDGLFIRPDGNVYLGCGSGKYLASIQAFNGGYEAAPIIS